MSQPTPYKLKHPLQLRNAAGEVTETITELQLHRLKGKDMRAMDSAKGNGSAMLAMVAASARIPPSTVDLLDGEDVTDAGMVVAGFLGGSLATGEKS